MNNHKQHNNGLGTYLNNNYLNIRNQVKRHKTKHQIKQHLLKQSHCCSKEKKEDSNHELIERKEEKENENIMFNNIMQFLPEVLIENIFSYSEKTIIYFHKKFPKLLNTSILTKPHLISQKYRDQIKQLVLSYDIWHNYNMNSSDQKYLIFNDLKGLSEFNCANICNINDEIFTCIPNVTKLICVGCSRLTNNSIMNLINSNTYGLTHLNCSCCYMKKILTHQKTYGLKKNCCNNCMPKLSGIAINQHINLSVLICAGSNLITDDAFTTLSNLTKLHCQGCNNITGNTFHHLTNLTELDFSGCQNITDETLILPSNLVKLFCCNSNVNFKGNEFRKLKNLNELVCTNSKGITDFAFENLASLFRLDCSYCSKVNGCTMKNMKKLIELNCIGCKEVQLDYIAAKRLKNLQLLWCSGCIKIDDDAIQNMTHLQSLKCAGCKGITDVSIYHLNLNLLECADCIHITDLSIITQTNLTFFDCCNCPGITDVSISKLVNLKNLCCYRNSKITDVSIILLKELVKLSCAGCHDITDMSIEKLVSIGKLQWLYANDCAISKEMDDIVCATKLNRERLININRY